MAGRQVKQEVLLDCQMEFGLEIAKVVKEEARTTSPHSLVLLAGIACNGDGTADKAATQAAYAEEEEGDDTTDDSESAS
jgi:hypothetical protein